VLDIEEEIDAAAIIIVPAKFAPQALEECGKKNIKNVIVTTGGFAEIGEEGVAIQNRMNDIMKTYNINIIGPNCLGLIVWGYILLY